MDIHQPAGALDDLDYTALPILYAAISLARKIGSARKLRRLPGVDYPASITIGEDA